MQMVCVIEQQVALPALMRHLNKRRDVQWCRVGRFSLCRFSGSVKSYSKCQRGFSANKLASGFESSSRKRKYLEHPNKFRIEQTSLERNEFEDLQTLVTKLAVCGFVCCYCSFVELVFYLRELKKVFSVCVYVGCLCTCTMVCIGVRE